MFRSWSLRAQLMAILSLLAVTPTAVLGALAIGNARGAVRDEVIRGNLALIRSIGQQLNTTLQDTRRALLVAASAWAGGAAAASQPSAGRGSPPNRPIARVLGRLRDEFSLLRSVVLLDREGDRVGGDGDVDFPLDLANTYGGYVSEVRHRAGGGREVVMVVQARDRRGALVGFVAAVVDLGFVGQRLAEARIGPGASLLVVDGSGRLVAAAVAKGAALPAMPKAISDGDAALRDHHPAVDRVLATHTEGDTAFVDARGREWIAVYRNIAGMSEFRAVRWAVVLSQPRQLAFALARKTTRDTLLVALAVLVLALCTAALVARGLARPLARLVQQTQRVAEGDMEVAAAQIEGSAEIALLAERFAQMIQRLRDNRDRLYALTEFRRNLVRSIPLGVISIDREGTIRSINPTQESLSNVAADAVVGRRLGDVFPDPGPAESAEAVLPPLDAVLERGEIVDLTFDNRPTPFTPTARERYRVRISPLRDRAGEVAGAVIIQEDLSRRARLEQQLLRSEKLSSVGVLAAGVAHEINNPLTTILGYAKFLLETCGEGEPNHEPLELIAEEAQRVQAIVRSLLDFSRKDRGQTRELSLNDVIRRTLTLASLQLRSHGIEVQRQLAEPLPAVLGDEQRLEQVFVNLVTNACQAMAGCGQGQRRLLVRSRSDERWIYVEFIDDGPGIAEENLHRVFDPFFSTKDPGEGTGLGLAVSHQIVTSHGGDIEVGSEPGEGTTFRVRLSRADRSEQPEGSGSDPSDLADQPIP